MIYTNKFINIFSLIFTIIIFFILNSFIFNQTKIDIKEIQKLILNIQTDSKKMNKDQNVDIQNWYIEIPIIELKAPIAEGTSNDILLNYVGHFSNTDKINGNIGLASNNKGYNYFENLKKLKNEDEIIYKYQDYEKRYIVNKIEIIKNTDWSHLEKTEENKITLITCIQNEPQYRRCIQAVEIEK